MNGRKNAVLRAMLFAAVLSCCLLACACAFASESGECGEHLTWTLADNGTLTITGPGEMDDYAQAPWSDPTAVTRLSFIAESSGVATDGDLTPGTEPIVGITGIGSHAFDGCTALTSVTIPDTVTRIGTSAFAGCTALTEAVLPAGVTALQPGTFAGCEALASITLPDLTMLGANCFQGCKALTEIALPDDLGSIGQNAFAGCEGLTSLTLPTGLRSIDAGAFSGCVGLTALSLPDGTRTVGTSAFEGCIGLTAVTLGQSLTTLDQKAFQNCTGLRIVSLPSTLSTLGYHVFYGCSGLKRIVVTGTSTQTPTFAFSTPYPVLYCYTGSTADTGSNASKFTRRHLDAVPLQLPADLIRIDSEALAGLGSAEAIRIGDAVTDIAGDAFDGTEAVIIAPAGSYAAAWATEHAMVLLEE